MLSTCSRRLLTSPAIRCAALPSADISRLNNFAKSVMVSHQAKSMYPAVKPFNSILEDQVKAIPILIGKENRITGITAKDNVIHG